MNVAKFVFHQGAVTLISKVVGDVFHIPSELAALTLNL